MQTTLKIGDILSITWGVSTWLTYVFLSIGGNKVNRISFKFTVALLKRACSTMSIKSKFKSASHVSIFSLSNVIVKCVMLHMLSFNYVQYVMLSMLRLAHIWCIVFLYICRDMFLCFKQSYLPHKLYIIFLYSYVINCLRLEDSV